MLHSPQKVKAPSDLNAATVYYITASLTGYSIHCPYTRHSSIPLDLIKLSKEWKEKASEGLKIGERRYFIVDPEDDTKGIILDEIRTPTWDDYSHEVQAARDCPKDLVYSALGLEEEAGEVSGKLKKYWRDKVYLDPVTYSFENIPEETKEEIIKELGDVLWYLNDLALGLGTSLENVAMTNIQKVWGRVNRGTIHGEGDNR